MKMVMRLVMFFKNKRVISNILIFVAVLVIGGIGISEVCEGLNDTRIEQTYNKSVKTVEKISSGGVESYEKKITEALKMESRLNSILVNIHKKYIYSQWFEENLFGIPNNYVADRIIFKPEDLEEVIFYISDDKIIYFLPSSMANRTIRLTDREIQVCEYQDEDQMKLYLYSYEVFAPEPERVIYPEPDNNVHIFSCEVQGVVNNLHFLGVAKVPFPKAIPDDAAKLYENEYTDAVVDIIHSLFYDMERYGEYQIYFGEYNYNELLDVKNKYGYKIAITVAIVGEETSYYWEFRAKEKLEKDGRVVVESNGGDTYSLPAEYDKKDYNYYAPEIDGIVHANRLVIPLTVTRDDEVKAIKAFKDEDDVNICHYHLE